MSDWRSAVPAFDVHFCNIKHLTLEISVATLSFKFSESHMLLRICEFLPIYEFVYSLNSCFVGIKNDLFDTSINSVSISSSSSSLKTHQSSSSLKTHQNLNGLNDLSLGVEDLSPSKDDLWSLYLISALDFTCPVVNRGSTTGVSKNEKLH